MGSINHNERCKGQEKRGIVFQKLSNKSQGKQKKVINIDLQLIGVYYDTIHLITDMFLAIEKEL